MSRFIVTKNFKDQYTGRYYGIGSIYVTSDEDRAAQLENAGYIAPDNTEAAARAMQQKQAMEGQGMQGQQGQGMQNQQQMRQNLQAEIEAQTIIDGKAISLKQAQAAQEAAEANVNTTGVTQDHNNNTEPVQAGQVAKDSQNTQAMQANQAAQQKQNTAAVKTKQSGQQALGKEVQNTNATQTASGSNIQNVESASNALENQNAFNQAQQHTPAENEAKATKAAAKAKKEQQ